MLCPHAELGVPAGTQVFSRRRPLGRGHVDLGVETVHGPSPPEARQPRGGSQKRACLESWVVVQVTSQGVCWDQSLLASQQAPVFTPAEHAVSTALGQLPNSTLGIGSFIQSFTPQMQAS